MLGDQEQLVARDPNHAPAAPASGGLAAAMPGQRIWDVRSRQAQGGGAHAEIHVFEIRKEGFVEKPDPVEELPPKESGGRGGEVGPALVRIRWAVGLAVPEAPSRAAAAHGVARSVQQVRAGSIVDPARDEPSIAALGRLEQDCQPVGRQLYVVIEHRYPSPASRLDAPVEGLADA